MKRLAVRAVIGLIWLVALGSCNQTKYTAEYYDVFDTYTLIVSYGKPVPPELHEELLRLHRLFDIYNDYEGVTNVKTVNDSAGSGEWFEASEGDMAALIRKAIQFSKVYDDTVDITLGSVLQVWHDYREEGATIPPRELLESAGEHVGYDKLEWDAVNVRFRLTDSMASLDVGALAKGYAADKVGRLAEELNFRGTISIGGSIWTSKKTPFGKRYWTVGIQDPDGGVYQTLNVRPGMCVSTSGNYERFYEVDGVRYHHIIDPKTLYPANRGYRSVTIVCSSALYADYISTYEFIRLNEELVALNEAQIYYIS
ncbi:MAG: FAD:protein FMN transferase [Oscillospiraceae bacterium]|nr:FAD:protein FMN transferase [Oscillospiraceae bacterium]